MMMESLIQAKIDEHEERKKTWKKGSPFFSSPTTTIHFYLVKLLATQWWWWNRKEMKENLWKSTYTACVLVDSGSSCCSKMMANIMYVCFALLLFWSSLKEKKTCIKCINIFALCIPSRNRSEIMKVKFLFLRLNITIIDDDRRRRRWRRPPPPPSMVSSKNWIFFHSIFLSHWRSRCTRKKIMMMVKKGKKTKHKDDEEEEESQNQRKNEKIQVCWTHKKIDWWN